MAFSEGAYLKQLQERGIQRGNTGRTGGFASAAVTSAPVKPTKFAEPGGLPGIVQKAADVTGQLGRFTGSVLGKGARFVGNTLVDVARQGYGAAKTYVDSQIQPIQNKAYKRLGDQLDQKQQQVMQEYKAGRMSKKDYIKSLNDLNEAFNALNQQIHRIEAGPTPQQRAADVVNTAINALTLGSFTTQKALGKEATNFLTNKLETAVTKVPSIRALAERNAQTIIKHAAGEGLGDAIKSNAKQAAIGLFVKRPIFYQQNIALAKDVYDDILKGDYGGAARSSAWLGVQMLEGGPVGAFLKGGKWLKGGLGKLAYGKGSFIDEISSQIGNKNPSQIARFLTNLEKKAPQEFEEASKVFRILQETNLQASGDDVHQAVESVLTHYRQHGMVLDDITPSQLYKDFSNWSKADELAQKTLKQGLIKDVSPEDANKYVVVRWDTPTKNAVAEAVEKAGPGTIAQMEALEELASRPGVGWGNNQILMNRLRTTVANAENGQAAGKAIREIATASTLLDGVPSKVARELASLGYSIAAPLGGRRTPVVDQNDLRKLVTGAIKGNSEVFDVAQAPQPILSGIAGALDSLGLSPRSTNQVANRKLQESVVANLDELGLGRDLGLTNTQGGDVLNGGKVILSKLQSYVESKRPALGLGKASALTDIRQLRLGEIQEALRVTKSQAKLISHAIMDGYLQVPLEFRGLGDKIVDSLYRYNPLQKHYARIQSALRYTYNPFFRTQERVETKLLSHAQANNLVWGKTRATLDDAVGVLDNSGIFTSSLPGEAAQDQVLGRITANITQAQKRDLAGLALDMAKSRGISLQEMALQHSDELDDALRVVVQYPRKGILASPLARTLNTVFFPMRYNTKVSMLAAQTLAKQPPSVQKAVLHSLFNMKDWLKSDEGIRWQSQNADAIQLLKWLTPVNSIEYTFNLLGHKPNSMAEFGQLGGLPLGVISQILDGQGIVNLNTPYVAPKTGDVFPKYIPKTSQARLATALTDLMGTMFTYPGRILGLPGKESTMKKVVAAFIDTNGSDFEKRIDMDRLTPLQKNWIRVLKGDKSEEALNALYHSPAPGGFDWYTLPPLNLPFKVVPPVEAPQPLPKRTGLPSGKRAGRRPKKIASPISAR